MKPVFSVLAVALLLATAVGVGTACTGDDDAAQPPLPQASPVPTLALDPFGVPLVRQESATKLYTIEVPSDWRRSDIGASNEETFDFYVDERLVSQIAITCEPIPVQDGTPWTVDQFIERDLFYARQFGGGEAMDRVPVTVGNLQGIAVSYATSLGTIPIVQRAVYLPSDCMWILRGRVFGTGDPSPYLALFNRIVGTFRPQTGS